MVERFKDLLLVGTSIVGVLFLAVNILGIVGSLWLRNMARIINRTVDNDK